MKTNRFLHKACNFASFRLLLHNHFPVLITFPSSIFTHKLDLSQIQRRWNLRHHKLNKEVDQRRSSDTNGHKILLVKSGCKILSEIYTRFQKLTPIWYFRLTTVSGLVYSQDIFAYLALKPPKASRRRFFPPFSKVCPFVVYKNWAKSHGPMTSMTIIRK